MKYEFKAKCIDVTSGGKNIILINVKDSKNVDVTTLDRVTVSLGKGKPVAALVDTTEQFVQPGELGLFAETAKALGAKQGSRLLLEPTSKPASVNFINAKIRGDALSADQVSEIIRDVMEDRISDIEATAFLISSYIRGMNYDEILALTRAIIDSGAVLDLKQRPIMDKHCTGGVPGNRTSMLIVPIVAAAGLTIPKTSSKAITTPAGTADTMSVLCRVDLNRSQLVEVIREANGCIVWGGAVNLAAADDKLIRLRHPLSLDPPGVMIASILAKKKAVGATHVLVDLPMGKGCKVVTKKQADVLAADFMMLGSRLGMEIECIVTPGYDPIGAVVGPSLEAREILRILEGEKTSPELIEKSLIMSGILLEMGGACKEGQGRLMAQKILDSGKALEKMKQIIQLQDGDPSLKAEDIKIGDKTLEVTAREAGRIHYANIQAISAIARAAGAPHDPGAGIRLDVEKGDKIKKGDRLFTVYAESDRKLEAAREAVDAAYPIELEKIILGKYLPGKPRVYEFGGR